MTLINVELISPGSAVVNFGVGLTQGIPMITQPYRPTEKTINAFDGKIILPSGKELPLTLGAVGGENNHQSVSVGIDYNDENYKLSNTLVWTNQEAIDLKNQTPSFSQHYSEKLSDYYPKQLNAGGVFSFDEEFEYIPHTGSKYKYSIEDVTRDYDSSIISHDNEIYNF